MVTKVESYYIIRRWIIYEQVRDVYVSYTVEPTIDSSSVYFCTVCLNIFGITNHDIVIATERSDI